MPEHHSPFSLHLEIRQVGSVSGVAAAGMLVGGSLYAALRKVLFQLTGPGLHGQVRPCQRARNFAMFWCCCTCINNFSFSSMTLSTCLHELSGSQRASLSVTLCPRNKRTAAPQIARGPACNEEHPCPSAGAHVREAMVYVRRGRHGLRPMHHTFLLAAQTEVWRHHVSIECIAPALVTSKQLHLQLNDSILATVQ